MNPLYQEINFDGLVGPTHHYAGLALGNLASATHRHAPAHPRAAALQGLAKMRALAALGLPQAVLPPLERPSIAALRAFGFTGPNEGAILTRAAREAPALLAACGSASSMWTANAATVAPSPDTADGKLHLTPANLSSHLHRALEAEETAAVLRRVFADRERFVVHPPLPGGAAMRDEGAANHTRLAPDFGAPGLHLFVFGTSVFATPATAPVRFPARQTREASEAVARCHGLDPARVFFLQQNPVAVDAGVFHNDVIAVGHQNVLLHHEEAFTGGVAAVDALARAYAERWGEALVRLVVPAGRIDLARAVRTYLFNSQLVTTAGDGMWLICPLECAEDAVVAAALEEIVADPANPLRGVRFFDLRQSMHNGGGPACLRQRVVMSPAERVAITARVFLDETLADELARWIGRHYRETLHAADLGDPALLDESRRALDELTEILRLGPLYPFQRATAR
jgi:succinylarginine dihydrolase